MHLRPSQRWLVFAQLCVLSVLVVSCGKGGDVTAPSGTASRTSTGGGSADFAWRPMDSGTTELLWGVSGSSAQEVIAVGTRGTAIHLDADTWQGKATLTFRDLCDVWGAADGRALSVGTFGTVLEYDGAAWESMTSGTSRGVYDVWGFEAYQAVAVGDSGTILRFDGSAWSPMASVTDVNLFGVWGSSPADLFAVGVGGTIVRYDGATWSFMTTPTPQNLSAVWGTASNNVWAVGDGGIVLHFDGTAWSPVAEFGANLYDVWGTAANDIWLVGKGGRIIHYDGIAWSDVESGTGADLFGVWGRSAGEVYAVGDAGTVLRYGPENETSATIFVLHDHPDGIASPPPYALRIDDLLGDGFWTFSFDYSDETESAFVTLSHDASLGTIHIAGRAFGGRVADDEWVQGSSGWIDIDFTYAVNVAVKDDCGELAGDDFYVTSEDPSNNGTISLDGWGGDQVFSFSDRSGENNGCSFIFDNDEDSKGNAAIADNPALWSGSGWIQPGANGSRDWLFIGEQIPLR